MESNFSKEPTCFSFSSDSLPFDKEPSGAAAGSCGRESGVGTSHSRICTPAPVVVAPPVKNGTGASTIKNHENHLGFIRNYPLSKNVRGLRHCQEEIDALPCHAPFPCQHGIGAPKVFFVAWAFRETLKLPSLCHDGKKLTGMVSRIFSQIRGWKWTKSDPKERPG